MRGIRVFVNSEYIYPYNVEQQCPKVHRRLYGRLYSIYIQYIRTY